VPRPPNSKRGIDLLAPKPLLWEVHIVPHDLEKGWAGMLPIAGATLVPIPQQAPGHLGGSVGSSWMRPLRVPYFGRGRQSPGPPPPTPPDPPTIATSFVELPPSVPPPPSEPVHLAVLVSMPTQTARGIAEHGPPVVEFGVAHVTYTHPTEP